MCTRLHDVAYMPPPRVHSQAWWCMFSDERDMPSARCLVDVRDRRCNLLVLVMLQVVLALELVVIINVWLLCSFQIL